MSHFYLEGDFRSHSNWCLFYLHDDDAVVHLVVQQWKVLKTILPRYNWKFGSHPAGHLLIGMHK